MRTQNNLKQIGIACHDDSFEFDLTSGGDPDEGLLIGLLLPAVQNAAKASPILQLHCATGIHDEPEIDDVVFGDGSVRVADDVVVDGRIVTAEDWG